MQLVLGRGVAWPVWCWAVARSGAGASQGFSGVGQWRGVVLGCRRASLVLGSGEEWCWGVAGLLCGADVVMELIQRPVTMSWLCLLFYDNLVTAFYYKYEMYTPLIYILYAQMDKPPVADELCSCCTSASLRGLWIYVDE